MNAEILIDFLRRLIKDAQRKVIVILDNLRVHHARKVKEWVQGKEEHDEYLNCDLKVGVHSGKPARSKDQLKKKVISHMRMLAEAIRSREEILQASEDSLCRLTYIYWPG